MIYLFSKIFDLELSSSSFIDKTSFRSSTEFNASRFKKRFIDFNNFFVTVFIFRKSFTSESRSRNIFFEIIDISTEEIIYRQLIRSIIVNMFNEINFIIQTIVIAAIDQMIVQIIQQIQQMQQIQDSQNKQNESKFLINSIKIKQMTMIHLSETQMISNFSI